MTSPTVSVAELARLIAIENHRVISLDEVAALTGYAKRSLELACRAGKLEHTRTGKSRGMTLAQVDLLVASNRTGVTELQPGAPSLVDEMQQARLWSQKNALRGRAS